MALTTEQRINALEQANAYFRTLIEALPKAYVTDLQWKQLDGIRAGEVQQLQDKVDTLESELQIANDKIAILEGA